MYNRVNVSLSSPLPLKTQENYFKWPRHRYPHINCTKYLLRPISITAPRTVHALHHGGFINWLFLLSNCGNSLIKSGITDVDHKRIGIQINAILWCSNLTDGIVIRRPRMKREKNDYRSGNILCSTNFPQLQVTWVHTYCYSHLNNQLRKKMNNVNLIRYWIIAKHFTNPLWLLNWISCDKIQLKCRQ